MAGTDIGGACSTAHKLHPKNCSGTVRYIAEQMGYKLPEKDANGLIDYFEDPKNGWTIVDETMAQTLADSQWLVVAGKKNPTGSGHVVVVHPGKKTESGGYEYVDKKTKTTMIAPNRGEYPRACSTSSGGWPGGLSSGDKTVFDSWGSSINYKGVKYWKAPALQPSQPKG